MVKQHSHCHDHHHDNFHNDDNFAMKFGYRLYYIDLLRYLLYLTSIFVLYSGFQLYGDDFLSLYSNNKQTSGVTKSIALFFLGSLLSVATIYSFYNECLIYKLYIFISIIIIILLIRWLFIESSTALFGWKTVLYLIPYYLGLLLSFLIIFMVFFQLNDCTINFHRQKKTKRIRHCHKHNDKIDHYSSNDHSHKHHHYSHSKPHKSRHQSKHHSLGDTSRTSWQHVPTAQVSEKSSALSTSTTMV